MTPIFVFGALFEPSYHMPLNKVVFAFSAPVWVCVMPRTRAPTSPCPKLGVAFLLGRFGILKPAAFLDIGAPKTV